MGCGASTPINDQISPTAAYLGRQKASATESRDTEQILTLLDVADQQRGGGVETGTPSRRGLRATSWRSGACSEAIPVAAGSRDLGWMNKTDSLGGFAGLVHFPMIALAVSQSDTMELGKVYDAPEGWHW